MRRQRGPVRIAGLVLLLFAMAGPVPALPGAGERSAPGLAEVDSTQATFRGLGDPPGGGFFSQAAGLSADGRVVVGQCGGTTGREACRWILPDGPIPLGPATFGPLGDFAAAASDDGSVVVGSRQAAPQQAGFTQFMGFRFSDLTGLVPLGDLPGGIVSSTGNDVSSDGSVVIGQSVGAAGIEAYRWTEATGMQPLGDLPGGPFASNALAVSGDGTVIIGHGNSALGIEGWRWTAATGMMALGDFPGGAVESSAEGISRNGRFIVGFGRTDQGLMAFRWTAATGLQPLGELPGGAFLSWAQVVSDDGERIAGRSEGPEGHAAFFWTPSFGVVPLASFLRLFGATGLDGWILLEVTGMTPDGRTIVGNGVNPRGDNEGFVATLPASLDCEEPACHACVDTDGDGFGDPGVPTNLCPVDDCPNDPDPGQTDLDHDGLGDACDPCPVDVFNDGDGDGLCADADNCLNRFNPDQADSDHDGPGDACDNCPNTPNSGQFNSDGDPFGDVCDLCPVTPDDHHDADGDGAGDRCDNCPGVSNPSQEDVNHDGAGDACQPSVGIDGFASAGGTLFVRAGAADPQGDALRGFLEIYEEPTDAVAMADSGDFTCQGGFHPAGRPGGGFGFAWASTQVPVLFDLDSNLGCADGVPDYLLSLGRCAGTSSGLTILDLTGAGPGDVICVRGAMEPEAELTIESLQPDLLRGRYTRGSRLVLSTPYGPGLPRETGIASLASGVTHRLVLTVTDVLTPPFSDEAFFVPAGESRLVINRPPRAVASARAAGECGGPAEGEVILDGTASTDPDAVPGGEPEILGYDWTLDPGGAGERPLGSGAVLTTVLPVGAHTVGLIVTDRFGERGADAVPIAVRNDSAAPTLTVTAEPNVLWPPNHKRVHVRVTWNAADDCDPAPVVTLVGVTSSEPDDAPGPADGSTAGDIFDVAVGTADGDVWLRAERIEGGPGRTYTLTYRVIDAAGNQATKTTTVRVPAAKGGLAPTRGYRPDLPAAGTVAIP